MNYDAFTYPEVKELMKRLSNTLKCGERVEVALHDEILITLIPSEAISNGLSVIDAYELGSNIVVVIENRFNRCG